jgi:release factor glutamine methyltransferase
VKTLADWLTYGEAQLKLGPHPEKARLDAESLLLGRIAQNKAWMLAHPDAHLSTYEADAYMGTLEERVRGEPIQYIQEYTEFYGLPIRVTPAVLIPRPETELLVERAILWMRTADRPHILDIGTGSGCIAVALARHLTDARITASDISAAALEVAEFNAVQNAVADRIRFLHGDLLAPVAGETFDIIVSNPPYVPTADRPSLSVEVRDHEPALALFAGGDGLDLYRRIAPAAHAALVPGGYLLLEIGFGQQVAVTALLEASGFQSIETFPDLQGIPRVVCALRGQA